MKASATPRHSTVSKYTQLLSNWKFTTARLTTPKASLVKSRDSSQSGRPRDTLNGSKKLGTSGNSPALTPRNTVGSAATPSVLKKYTKELFRRYDDRTAELTQILKEKESVQRKVESLATQVATLEADIQAQDRLLAQLTPGKTQPSDCPQAVQSLMDEVRAKLAKTLKARKH